MFKPRQVCALALAFGVVAGCGSMGAEVGSGATSSVTSDTSKDRQQVLPSESYDDEAVYASMQAEWGLKDKKVVVQALERVTDRYPQAYAGGSYDPEELKYTEWVVEDAEGAAQMRVEAEAAFDEVAGDSNLALEFASAPEPLTRGAEVQEQLLRAVREDPEWPEGLALTGSWDFPSGTYPIQAGDRYDDPDVTTYFARIAKGFVVPIDAEPAQPEGAVTKQAADHSNGVNPKPADGCLLAVQSSTKLLGQRGVLE